MNHALQHRPNVTLKRSESRNVSVGGVGQEQIHTFFAEACESTQIGEATIERKLVHLEVTSVQNKTCFRANGHGQRIWDGVVHGYELELVGTELFLIAFLNLQGVGLNPVLFELGFNECQGQS